LRGPVDPRELEVDPRTGMKNYIANEDGQWDTSKALVRRTLEQCIVYGRRYRANGNKHDHYEAYRLLGTGMISNLAEYSYLCDYTALHTMEDFPAHSNFCELALINLGYDQVFAHVGDYVRVQAPNGKSVPPLVTGELYKCVPIHFPYVHGDLGTFGGDDFQHSLLGEAGDKIVRLLILTSSLLI
jgi:hypothetical protein